MKAGSDSMTNQISDHTVSKTFCIIADRSGNIIQMISCFCHFDSFKETLTGYINQFLSFRADLPNCMGTGSIRMITFVDESGIQADNVSFSQNSLLTRDSMYNLIIYRYTDGCRISIVMKEIRGASETSDHFFTQMIDFPG